MTYPRGRKDTAGKEVWWALQFVLLTYYRQENRIKKEIAEMALSVLRLATCWTAMGLNLDSQQRQGILLSPQGPNRLWGSPCLVFHGCQDLLSRDKATLVWSWPLNLHLMPWLNCGNLLGTIPWWHSGELSQSRFSCLELSPYKYPCIAPNIIRK